MDGTTTRSQTDEIARVRELILEHGPDLGSIRTAIQRFLGGAPHVWFVRSKGVWTAFAVISFAEGGVLEAAVFVPEGWPFDKPVPLSGRDTGLRPVSAGWGGRR